jgi:ferredoxin-like protein FixX
MKLLIEAPDLSATWVVQHMSASLTQPRHCSDLLQCHNMCPASLMRLAHALSWSVALETPLTCAAHKLAAQADQREWRASTSLSPASS